MADNKIQLVIEALDKTNVAFNALRNHLKDARGETVALQSATKEQDAGVGSLIGRYVTLTVAIAAVVKAAKEAISYLAQIETATLGIASSFMLSGKYIDATSGKALAAQDALKAAMGDAKDIVAELQYANFQTIATLDQLINAYQVTLPVAMARGFNRQQVKDFTVAMVQAAGAIGLPMNQLAEETRSILTEAIQSRTSRIATVLGLRNEDIAVYRGNAEGLFNFLMEKLSAYRTAGVESQKTWAGLWSNIKDIGLQTLGKAFTPLFEALKYELKELSDSIVTLDEKTKTIKWNPEFIKGIEDFRNGLRDVIAELYRMGMFLDKIGGTMAMFKGDTNLNEMFRQRYMASEKALQDMAMRGEGWKPVTPDIDKQMREAAAAGKKLFEQTQINVGTPAETTQQLLRYYREIGGAKPAWQAGPQPEPTTAQERVSVEKKTLEATLARYKAEAEAGAEANKEYIAGRKLALEQGLIDQKTFLADETRMEEASVNLALDALTKKEAAIIASYEKQKKLQTDQAKAAVISGDEEKELAVVRGDIAREQSRLIEAQMKGKIDAIEYSKKLAAAERGGELAVMTEIARLENEANKLKIERHEMTAPEALRIELDWETRLNEKKRANLALDLKAATDDSQKKKLESEIAVIDKGLADIDIRRLKTAEADRKAAADRSAIREAEIQGQLAQIDIEEAAGKAHRATLTDRIRLTGEILVSQEAYLAALDKGKDPASWYAQAKAIDETRRKLVELGVEQRAATGTMGEGFGWGWQDWVNNARSAFDMGKELATSTADAMRTSFSDIFFDSWTGNLQSAGSYLRSFAQTILRTLANVISEIIVKWLLMKAGALAATGTAVSGIAAEILAVGKLTAAYYALASAKAAAGIISAAAGAGGGGAYTFGGGAQSFTVNPALVPGAHGGGEVGKPAAFYRLILNPDLIPRRHSGGLAPDERVTINKVGERFVTQEQNDWLTAIAKSMEGGQKPAVNIDIANIVSPDLLDSYLATGRGQNAILNVLSSRAGTIRRILRNS